MVTILACSVVVLASVSPVCQGDHLARLIVCCVQCAAPVLPRLGVLPCISPFILDHLCSPPSIRCLLASVSLYGALDG